MRHASISTLSTCRAPRSPDTRELEYLNELPTALPLRAEGSDRVRVAARTIMRPSPDHPGLLLMASGRELPVNTDGKRPEAPGHAAAAGARASAALGALG